MLLSIASVALANTKTDTIVYVKPVIVEEVKPETETERIERLIRETFPEQPEVMLRIAKCESGLQPRVVSPTKDVGIYQINLAAHGQRLKELDLDPYDVEQNLIYARMLYDNRGTGDWYMSKHCWNK